MAVREVSAGQCLMAEAAMEPAFAVDAVQGGKDRDCVELRSSLVMAKLASWLPRSLLSQQTCLFPCGKGEAFRP